jgi:hypothetical protein
MSKLIYFVRYRYRGNRPCSFIELQEHVMHKLEQDDIDTTFEYAIRTFARQERYWDPFGIVINTTKDKTYIDEDEIEDQSIWMIDAFRFITRCKEINCHQVFSWKEKIIRNRTYLWYYSYKKICIF